MTTSGDPVWDGAITCVRVTVHNTGRKGNSLASDNHTTTYLIVRDASIQLNMRTDPEYITGIMDMQQRDYIQSRSSLKNFNLLPIQAITPGYVYSLLKNNGFDDYTFTGGGIGCRYWKYVSVGSTLF